MGLSRQDQDVHYLRLLHTIKVCVIIVEILHTQLFNVEELVSTDQGNLILGF